MADDTPERNKRLIVCFDGTWNSADSEGDETNVARIARAIPANSHGGPPQLVLYLRGVGSTGHAIQRLIDGAVGQGVDENIRSGYMFLAQNYVPQEGRRPADEIYLFGFSRGAFTARSLAGLIGCCGLLKRQSLQHLPAAWTYYRTEKNRSREGLCKSCTGADTHETAINFLGVWDTVGSLGVPTTIIGGLTRNEYTFHDTSPSKAVKRAAHALAIDEHRDEFIPTLWTGKNVKHVEQVWFAGAHSDVGGGYKDRQLADIPLLWMAQQAKAAGLDLDWKALPDPAKINPLATRHESREGWSMKDRVTPTVRCVEGWTFEVPFYERLYAPVDEHGALMPTVNESVHPSVFERLGKPDRIDGKQQAGAVYAPKNLKPRPVGAKKGGSAKAKPPRA